jgi:excisionase family DNA binding protein
MAEQRRNDYPALRLSDQYVSIGQAASLLSVNRATIRRWLKGGRLRGESIGRVTLIPKQDVLFITQQGYGH